VRFLLDENLSPTVAQVARGLGLEVVSVHDIGRRGLSDHEQVEFAASEGRTLVTGNRDDFIRLTFGFYQAGRPHRGVLIVPFSIPNHQPERIAHALRQWTDQWPGDTEPSPYFIDFLVP
jgi:predicted nuclease of predicted toxin-antitoxin system